MTSNRFRLLLAAIILLLSGVPIQAEMPPISDDDKKFSTVPGHPGASAVILYREEIFDDIRHSARIQERIKILTEEGRKYADVSLPYDRKNLGLTGISARTIHPDGKIIPFEGKPFEKTLFKGKDVRYNVKTFTLPDVQPSSIIEYKYTLIYPDQTLYPPRWVVQSELWQKQVSFRFYMYARDVVLEHDQLAHGIAYTMRLGKGMAPKEIDLPSGDTYFEMNVNDVEPFVDEPFMPDSDQFKMNVRFYYRVDNDPKKYWDSAVKYWDKDVEKFIGKKNGVAETVARITSPGDSVEQKARKIYAFAVGLDNEDYLASRTSQEIKTLEVKPVVGAEDVLTQKRGDPEDITRTFVALARAAGLKAYVMRITSRENAFFDSAFLDFHQLDDEVAIVEVDGKQVFLDPGSKFSRYGLLDWRHTMCGGYRQTDKKPELAETPSPSYKDAIIQRIARLHLNPDFTVAGPAKIIYSGFYATMRRQSAAKTDDEGKKKLLEDEVKSWLPADSEVKFTGANWNDTEADLAVDLTISASVASNAGKRILLPANPFHFLQKPMFPHAERVNGVYLYYPSREVDDVTFTLPSTLMVESVPQKESVQLQYAAYASESRSKDNTLGTVRDLANAECIFDKGRYPELKGFYDKVKTGDEQQFILRSNVNAASGN